MTLPAFERLTYAEYLSREARSEVKHEFFEGQMFAMAGGTPLHALVSGNVAFALRVALSGKPCRVFPSDLRIRIQASGLTTYPDVSVVCGEVQLDEVDPHAITNPGILVEVLSESTEAYDRGEKFAHYRRIPALRHVLLVSTSRQRVEHFRRDEAGDWVLREAGGQDQLQLDDVGLAVAGFYEQTEVPETTDGLR